MSLLDRIAHSDGNPQRSIIALRLINERLAREMAQCSPYARRPVPEGYGLISAFMLNRYTPSPWAAF